MVYRRAVPSGTAVAATAAEAAARKRDIQLIHIGRSALGLDDDTYRLMLSNLCGGKTSSTALSAPERQAVLKHMRSHGFVLKPRAGAASVDHPVKGEATWQHASKLRMMRAMWYALAAAGHVEPVADATACSAAIEAWAKRQLSRHTPPLDALRLASGHQMQALLEALKRWCARTGVNNQA